MVWQTNQTFSRKLSIIFLTIKQVLTGVPHGSINVPLLFNIFINDIIEACYKFACTLLVYADDTTLHSTLGSFGNNTDEIKNSIKIKIYAILHALSNNMSNKTNVYSSY